MKAISLFSGAGGFDFGFKQAGIDIVWANDSSKDACATYRYNIGKHIVYGDIANFTEELKNIPKVDIIFGGPPCQGFSVAGKMDTEDERNNKVFIFHKIVDMHKPKAFVMENVSALVKFKKWKPIRDRLVTLFEQSGYVVDYGILDASDFGVPQKRLRAFIIGYQKALIPETNFILESERYKKHAPTVREALSVLDRAGTGNNKNINETKIVFATNSILRKTAYSSTFFNGKGRVIRLDGYSCTIPASSGNSSPIIDNGALYDNKTPWIERLYFNVTHGIKTPHTSNIPKTLRRITTEEAAILQTFPIDYRFNGTKTSVFKQIGNAVPCGLAYAIAQIIKHKLQHI